MSTISPSSFRRWFGLAAVFVTFLSTLFRGFTFFVGFRGIGLTPYDLVGFVLIFVFLVDVLTRGTVSFQYTTWIAVLLAGLLLFAHVIAQGRSPQPVRGLTLIMQLIRNVGIFVVVLTYLDPDDLPTVNAGVFAIITLVGTLMVPVYVSGVVRGVAVTPLPQTLFVRPQYLRSQWFTSDPNFFGITIVVGALCGVQYVRETSRPKVALGGLAITTATLVTTLSRSSIGVFVVAIIGWGISGICRRLWTSDARVTGSLGWNGVVGLLTVATGAASGIFLIGRHDILQRFTRVIPTERLHLWSEALSAFDTGFLFGLGLRAVETSIGRYVHNSYIGLLVRSGFVGLGVYALFVVFVTRTGVSALIRGELDSAAPWLWAWFAVLGFMVFFSYLYMPKAWLIPAILLNCTVARKCTSPTTTEASTGFS